MSTTLTNFTDDFESYAIGAKPPDWYGSCSVVASGVVVISGGVEVISNGLLIGTLNAGDVSVRAPYPRLDATIPVNFSDAWTVSWKMKVQAMSGCISESTLAANLTLATIGSIDREDKLKIQIAPDEDGHIVAYPLVTSEHAGSCEWVYFKLEMWDAFFNLYINDMTTPVIQQAVPMQLPYWRAGDNRIALTFPVDGLHQLIIDDYEFSTTSTLPSDVYTKASCFAIRDSNNAAVPEAPVYLIPVTTAANQITDTYGRFNLTDVPINVDILVVSPDLTTKLMTATNIAVAKQRRLVSGADEYSNIVVDASGAGISGARLYYIDVNNPAFYTDSDGRIARTSVGSGYHAVIKSANDESVYLDATLFE